MERKTALRRSEMSPLEWVEVWKGMPGAAVEIMCAAEKSGTCCEGCGAAGVSSSLKEAPPTLFWREGVFEVVKGAAGVLRGFPCQRNLQLSPEMLGMKRSRSVVSILLRSTLLLLVARAKSATVVRIARGTAKISAAVDELFCDASRRNRSV